MLLEEDLKANLCQVHVPVAVRCPYQAVLLKAPVDLLMSQKHYTINPI